jgi:hypothetical protein
VSSGQCEGSPWPYSRFSILDSILFLASSSSVVLTRLSGPHYFSKNLVAPGIEPRTSESVARNPDHYTTEAVKVRLFMFFNSPLIQICVLDQGLV